MNNHGNPESYGKDDEEREGESERKGATEDTWG